MIAGLVFLFVLGTVGFGIFVAARAALSDRDISVSDMDPAGMARSVAVYAGVYLAMVAVTVGLIDLLQAMVGGARIAGSNIDLARGLALIIVGGPVLFLLLRLCRSWATERAEAGDHEASIGWSVHLVVGLTTGLVGVLVSAAQVIDDIASGDGAASTEVAQLAGWLLMWLVYWFGLRPWFGLRGALHLALGTIAGLAWLVAGVIGTAAIVLDDLYETMFTTRSSDSDDVVQWVLTAVVGALVWAWYWWHLDSDRGVEGPTRKSPSWFFTVVVAAIVPSVVTLLVVVTASIVGTLIWFIGTTDETAADWFEPAPSLLAAGVVGATTWTFHRLLLDRDGHHDRNEALRFHDYVLAAVGLVGAVSATALLIEVVVETLAAGRGLADSFERGNDLIRVTVTLVVTATVWWSIWERIDRNRRHDPLGEANSVWRKLYLVVAAGAGGLILAVSTIWILFTSLRDLFDGTLGSTTIADMASPIGWAAAVAGAVWYHIDVWRADRAVLEVDQPLPPTRSAVTVTAEPEPPKMRGPDTSRTSSTASGVVWFRWADPRDGGQLFTLFRAAASEPARQQRQADFMRWLGSVRTLVAADGERIVASISVRRPDSSDDEPVVAQRLLVAPDHIVDHVGRDLLGALEEWLRSEAVASVRIDTDETVPTAVLGPLLVRLGYRNQTKTL